VRSKLSDCPTRRVLLLTPPLLQPNSPYPATMHLKAFLDSIKVPSYQVDLSIKVLRDILIKYGDEATDEMLEILSSDAPFEAKVLPSRHIEKIADLVKKKVDKHFGFSRYAERECLALHDFGELERLVKSKSVMDLPLKKHLKAAIESFKPTDVWVTCPFPGTLVGAFKIASYIKKNYPHLRLVLGGGYVSTELRSMTDRRPRKYFDLFAYDSFIKKPFICPDYDEIDWSEYFDVCLEDGLSSRLWASGKWVKLIMAQGCYWHKCAFCDVCLSYIGKFKMPEAKEIVDAMQKLGRSFHFVDEAMPPKLVEEVCREIIARDFECEWWGNVRFDSAFTDDLAKLMAKAGCIALTGALECANDRLLTLMNKGITLKSAERVLRSFKRAGIMIHTYLMYGFPTETIDEQRQAEKYVKSLARKGLIHSAYWHRFALTVHSPIYKNPEMFSIKVKPLPQGNVFALNEVDYT
jgi:hypothetical protein